MWWVLVAAIPACGYPQLPRLDVNLDAAEAGSGTGSDAADGGDASNMPAPFAPLHLDPAMQLVGAPDLTLSADPSLIDTAALTVNGTSNGFFVQQGNYAVLFTRTFSVPHDVTITGTLPLIVVARDAVVVSASIDLGATGTTPGPGATAAGIGVGGSGTTSVVVAGTRVSGGGGGGGFGSLGASGGNGGAQGGAGGLRYGLQITDPLTGGSAGGLGGNQAQRGGAGGGALQISSAVSITITGSHISAGGGGGSGGGTSANGGCGGGAGGEIILEAPMIMISSTLAANGGGGGGGGTGGGPLGGGTPGGDGFAGDQPATGGLGGDPQGSDGGRGAAGQSASFVEAQPGSSFNSKGGGGGGGAGRIWLRYRASTPPVANGAVFSPPAGLDPTLP